MRKPSEFSIRHLAKRYGYVSNVELRVDGYTLEMLEVSDDGTVALADYGETLIEASGFNELLAILLRRRGIRYSDLHDYAGLRLPDLSFVVLI